MSNYEKRTVPCSSVGADVEQPNTILKDHSISNIPLESKDFEKQLREMARFNSPRYLHTVTMTELFDEIYESRPSLIEGLLHTGIYLFVGAPKLGKSFFMLQLAYHISIGRPLWGYDVEQGTVLYMALEDDYPRLQKRLFRMFGVEESEDLHFATRVHSIANGLEGQISEFIEYHPNTKLIIIDTLQKVRESSGEKYSYASDYDLIGTLKGIAEKNKVCLLLVHHTRKQQAEDKFEMISGTNGLLGAADGAFLFQKEKRTDNTAMLDISGRDQQDQRLYLKREETTLAWNLERAETEVWKEPPDPLLEKIAELVNEHSPTWSGTATELVAYLDVDLKPNILTKRLNVNVDKLLQAYKICYQSTRLHDHKNLSLKYLCVDCVGSERGSKNIDAIDANT